METWLGQPVLTIMTYLKQTIDLILPMLEEYKKCLGHTTPTPGIDNHCTDTDMAAKYYYLFSDHLQACMATLVWSAF